MISPALISDTSARRGSGEQIARDRAASAVVTYLHRLGFPVDSETAEEAAIEVALQAAESLPKLRRSDASIVRTTAIRLAIRDLDHWLRLLSDESDHAVITNMPALAASTVETSRRRVVPIESHRTMAPQRFRNRPAILARWAYRSACDCASRVRLAVAGRTVAGR